MSGKITNELDIIAWNIFLYLCSAQREQKLLIALYAIKQHYAVAYGI